MARLLSGSGTVTGTGALTSIAPGADGQVLTSTGSVWQSEAAASGPIAFFDSFTIAGSNANIAGSSGDWHETGLTITVASANVALGSKIYVSYSTAFGIAPGTGQKRIDVNLERTAPSTSVIHAHRYIGQNGTTGQINPTVSASAVDTSLGVGDHIYKVKHRQAAGSTGDEAGTVHKLWYIDSILTMQIMVIV